MTLRLSTLQKNPAIFLDIRDLLEEIANAEETLTLEVIGKAMPKDGEFLMGQVNTPERQLIRFKEKARQILEAAKKAEG